MPPQVAPSVPATRIDGRSLAAAGICVLALFIDGLGWLFAVAGIYLLRRSSFSSSARWVLGSVALGPKLLFIGIRAMNAPSGLSFPVESTNLATSSALWAWAGLAIGLGLLLVLQSRRAEYPPNEPAPDQPQARFILPLAGVCAMAVGVVLLLGLTDGFQRIDDAGHGRWALHHAVKGTVASFSAGELAGIVAQEREGRRENHYEITARLQDGRAFSLTTRSTASLDELRKFAATAALPPGRVSIVPLRRPAWTNGASGITLQECAGVYEQVDGAAGARSTLEFWIDNGRLAGKETLADSGRTHVRMLRNIKFQETGETEFQPASYFEASQQRADNTTAISFGWSSQPETGKFVPGGFQAGARNYRKTAPVAGG
ncbi:MAG: hypothetical protein U0Q18_36670 [Bryobacteraceae bacterium]